MEPAIEEGSGLQFTEATEFARAIGAEEIEADTKAEAAEAGDGDAEMEDDIEGDRNAEDKEVHKEEEQKEDGSSQAPGAGVFTGQKLGRVSRPP